MTRRRASRAAYRPARGPRSGPRRRRVAAVSIRSLLYALARLLGDVNAVTRGPAAIGKRIVRKAAYRAGARGIEKLLR